MSFTPKALSAFESHRAANGESITYTRGAHSVALIAVPGDKPTRVSGPDGVWTTIRLQDFAIKAAELILNSVTVLPQRGDVITWGIKTYAVNHPDPQSAPWEGMEPSDSVLRVHCLKA